MSELPRHDANVERMVLASWVSDSNFRQGWDPESELFYLPEHKEIAAVFHDNFGAERWNEVYTVAELEKRDKLHQLGGRERILEVLCAPALSDPHGDIERLRELKALRELNHEAYEIQRAISQGERLHEVQARMRGAVEHSVTAVGVPLLTGRDLMHQVMGHLTAEGPVSYCSTGWRELDRAIGGFRGKKVWVLGADTSVGKSSWVCQVVNVNRKRGRRVLVVTVEDEAELYGWRLACADSLVNFERFRDRRLTEDEWINVTASIKDLAADENYCVIDASGGVPIEHLAGQIRAVVIARHIHLVVLDYAQAAICSTPFRTRVDEIRHIGRTFTNAVKGAGAAGIINSQVTVEEGKRLTKKNIRDCRDLANAAEGILLMELVEERRQVKVEKGKIGGAGEIMEAPWNPISACFVPDVGGQLDLGYDEDAA